MDWVDYMNDLKNTFFHYINNNSDKTIVLFGSCHLSTIGYMLNTFTNQKFNIYVITSWYFKDQGYENFDMDYINDRIQEIIKKSDVFIYMKHENDYGIKADEIEKYVNMNTLVMKIPNLRLAFKTDSKEDYLKSLEKLKNSILESDFVNFQYILENHRNHLFFNVNEHPTHFLLYLLSRSILNKICKINHKDSMNDYLNSNFRNHFLQLNRNYIILPGRQIITQEISEMTTISCNAEYFDC
jgi:hypothetical protein